jgi:hypothetical protein
VWKQRFRRYRTRARRLGIRGGDGVVAGLSVRGAPWAVGDREFGLEFGDLVAQAAVLGQQRRVALAK